MIPPLTHELLLDLLRYDPETGHFWWLRLRSKARLDRPAGALDRDGYVGICINRRRYTGGRLAYFYMTGTWPTHFIDHINLNRADNRWSNLRPATPLENAANRGPGRDNTSGIKGVSFHKCTGRWRAELGHKGYIGLFATKEEAARAYEAAAIERYGEFARVA